MLGTVTHILFCCFGQVNGYLLQFKLAPAFGLYMVMKHHLSPEFQPSSSSTERRKCLVLALKNIITQFRRAVKVTDYNNMYMIMC